jgi:hypothetical protein
MSLPKNLNPNQRHFSPNPPIKNQPLIINLHSLKQHQINLTTQTPPIKQPTERITSKIQTKQLNLKQITQTHAIKIIPSQR